jgi:excisionase family DNA binding protein
MEHVIEPSITVTERATVPRIALRIAEAARALGISKPTVEAEIRAGRLRVRRVGRRVLVPVAAIEEWLSADAA